MPPLALLLPIALGTGIGLFFTFPSLPWQASGLAALITATFALIARWRHLYPLFLAAILLTALCGGFWRAGYRTEAMRAPVLSEPLKAVWASGTITQLEPKENGWRITLAHVGLDGLEPQNTPHFIRVSLKKIPDGLVVGDSVRVRAMLYPPSPPVMPGAFNFARHAYFQQLGATGYAITPLMLQGGAQGEPPARWSDHLQRLRDTIAAHCYRFLAPAEGAIAAALLMGEQTAIPAATRDSLQKAGLSHILSVSGLHMALVTGFIFLLIRRLLALWPYAVLHWPLKKIAAAAAIAASAFYLLLAGAPVPAQRSFLMLALVLLAVILDRTAHPLRLVALAAFVLLLWTPESLLTASFQLSFAATAALVAYYEWRRDQFREPSRTLWLTPLHYLRETAAASCVAALATAPYSLYHFGNASISGIVANMLALPLTGFFTMPAAVLTLVTMPFGLQALPLHFMGLSLTALLWIATTTNEALGWVVQLPSPPVWTLVAVTLLGMSLLLLKHRHRWLLIPLTAVIWAAGISTVPTPLLLTEERYLAIQLPHNHWLLLGPKQGNWVTEQWQQRLGTPHFMTKEEALAQEQMHCDPEGCIIHAAAGYVALPDTQTALTEDCALSSLILSEQTPPDCGGYHLRTGLTQVLYREKEQFRLWTPD